MRVHAGDLEVAEWDNQAFALAKLVDGRYLAVSEWEDSSGHGCQCGGAASVHSTLEEALMLGLDEFDRAEARRVLAETTAIA